MSATVALGRTSHRYRPSATGFEAALKVPVRTFTIAHEPAHRRGGAGDSREPRHKWHCGRELRARSFETEILLGYPAADELACHPVALKTGTFVLGCRRDVGIGYRRGRRCEYPLNRKSGLARGAFGPAD